MKIPRCHVMYLVFLLVCMLDTSQHSISDVLASLANCVLGLLETFLLFSVFSL